MLSRTDKPAACPVYRVFLCLSYSWGAADAVAAETVAKKQLGASDLQPEERMAFEMLKEKF